jgi:hypothetical protein
MILRCDWARFHCELLVARVKVGCHSEYDLAVEKSDAESSLACQPFAKCTTRRHAAIKLAERPPVAGFLPQVFAFTRVRFPPSQRGEGNDALGFVLVLSRVRQTDKRPARCRPRRFPPSENRIGRAASFGITSRKIKDEGGPSFYRSAGCSILNFTFVGESKTCPELIERDGIFAAASAGTSACPGA